MFLFQLLKSCYLSIPFTSSVSINSFMPVLMLSDGSWQAHCFGDAKTSCGNNRNQGIFREEKSTKGFYMCTEMICCCGNGESP